MAFQYQRGQTRTQPLVGAFLAGALALYGLAQERAEHRDGNRKATGCRSTEPQADPPQQPRAEMRGRGAERPSDIPKRGWWDILMRVKDDNSQKSLSLIAAGAAFYAFLAIPSAITALVSLYGLVFDPASVERQVQALGAFMPADVIKFLSDQLTAITTNSGKTLGIGLVISIGIALWSARSGTASMVTALNVVYEEQEKRGMARYYATTVGLTVVTILFAALALAFIAIVPAILDLLPLGDLGKTIASALRWPILVILVMVSLAVVYRYAPSRDEPKWRWVSWGAVAATVLWIIGSALFSLYVGQFASYNKTYGSLGGVVVLLMWLYLSAFVVLIGAELNAEIEHQTARDSTTGREKPIGQRGARMADTVGASR